MSKQLKRFAYNLVQDYATFRDDLYCLAVYEIPDFVQHEFAALFMSDKNHAAEATGPDNILYESKMLPALTKYLANSTDKDFEIEFKNIWKDCVTKYFYLEMHELIEDALAEFNSLKGCGVFGPYEVRRDAHY